MADRDTWGPELLSLDNDYDYSLFNRSYTGPSFSKEYFKRKMFLERKAHRKYEHDLETENKNLKESLDEATKKLHKQEELLQKLDQFKKLGMELFGDAITEMVMPMIENGCDDMRDRIAESEYLRRIGDEA